MKGRICVVTAGHLATCPRMLKAADAFAEAGYRVRVVSARFMRWASEADAEIRRSRAGSWDWSVVEYGRNEALLTHMRTGLRFRQARLWARAMTPEWCPLTVAARAYSRAHTELVRAAVAEPADLFYGGTAGALAAVAEAGRRTGKPYALDLEDFHTAEQDDESDSHLPDLLAGRIEADVLPRAAFLTAGSPAIAEAYTAKYGLEPIAINNTFSLPPTAPHVSQGRDECLRLYWFSQTVGPGRGLEDAVNAIGEADLVGELHLRGNPVTTYLERLQRLARQSAPRLRIVLHEPAPSDLMVNLAREYDVGLSLEQPRVFNRELSLGNKVFTYMLAGLAVVLSNTRGHRALAPDIGQGALVYSPGDIDAFASGLSRWADDKVLLAQARWAAWEAARRRWHWEHPLERGALLDAVAGVLQ